MTRWLTVAAALGLGSLSVARSAVAAEAPAATHTIAEIRDAYSRSRERLRSFEVEIVSRTPISPDDPKRLLTLRRIIAIRGSACYIDSKHSTAAYPEALDLRRSEIYFDGKVLHKYRPPLLHCTTYTQDIEASSIPARWNFVVECLAWWPPDDPQGPPSGSDDFFLHEALANLECRVLPRQEAIDGVWCHVVQRPGADKFWLDEAIGFHPRRRERLHGHPSVNAMTFELSDYREESPGVWIPRKMHRAIYNPRVGDAPGKTAPTEDAEAAVVRVAVNRVPMERFQLRPRPGMLIEDAATHEVRQVPGGLDFIDTVVELARRRARIAARGGRSLSSLSVVTPAALIATIAVLAYRVVRTAGSRRLPARRFDAPLITADRAFQERAVSVYGRIQLLAGCERN